MSSISRPTLTRHISLDFKNPSSSIEIEAIINKKKPLETSPRPDESPQIKIKKSLFEKIQQESQKAHDTFVSTNIQSRQLVVSQYRSRLLEKQREVDEKIDEIFKLQQTLESKESHIYSMERLVQVNTLNHQSEIDKKANEIFKLQRILQEKESHISLLEKRVQVIPSDILDTKIICPYPAKLLTIRQYIEEKRIVLNAMQKQLNGARKEISNLQQGAQENQQTLFFLNQQLQEKHQMILNLNQQLQYQLNLNATKTPVPPRQHHVRFQEQQTPQSEPPPKRIFRLFKTS